MEIIKDVLDLVAEVAKYLLIVGAFFYLYSHKKRVDAGARRQDSIIDALREQADRAREDNRAFIKSVGETMMRHSKENREANEQLRQRVMEIYGDIHVLKDATAHAHRKINRLANEVGGKKMIDKIKDNPDILKK